jgi:ATPase subunit of ABC transporter with duplicated ATPase domains
MRRPVALLRRHARPACLYRSIRSISSTPPIINIQNGSFFRQYPSPEASPHAHNPPLYPKLNFVLPSKAEPTEASGEQRNLQHWGIIGSSGRTTFLKVLQGQYISSPPQARSYPYLASEEFTGKHRSPNRAIRYVGFADDALQTQNRGAYLSARYESRREDTDFTLLDYLKGKTSLNPMEGEEDGTLHDDALLGRVISSLKLEKLANLPVGNLSNGQTRRARIAKALLGSPEVLLIDEPFSMLSHSSPLSSTSAAS